MLPLHNSIGRPDLAIQRSRLLSIAVLVLFIGIFAGFAQAQGKNGPEIRHKTFDKVWKTINEKYFDPTFGGVDWADVRARYEPRVASVKDDAEFYELLRAMLKELPVSHLSLVDIDKLDAQLARSVVTIGIGLRNIDDAVVVTRVLEDSPAQREGLRPGFTMRAIDGNPVIRAKDAENQLTDNTQKHRVRFLDDHGAEREAVLENRLPPAEKLEKVRMVVATRYAIIESRRLAGGIGYIHFTNFIAPLKKRLSAALQSMKDAPGIIIDLRGNSGGDSEVGMALAGMLVEKETLLAVTRTRKGDESYYKAKPHKNPYLGPVVFLLDEESGSESEQVSAGLQAAGRAVVVGKTSRGEDMDATIESLPMKAFLLYPMGQPRTPKGVVIDGRGVRPDIEVSLCRDGLLAGRDAQLEAAAEYIQKQTHR